jgi:hypothetical protein
MTYSANSIGLNDLASALQAAALAIGFQTTNNTDASTFDGEILQCQQNSKIALQ